MSTWPTRRKVYNYMIHPIENNISSTALAAVPFLIPNPPLVDFLRGIWYNTRVINYV